MTRIPFPKHADETCPHCRTTHRLPVEQDEDGPYVEIDTEVCNDDHCTRQLCSSCPQFRCDICTLLFCAEHGVRVGHETLCPECADLIRKDAIAEVSF